ncbi:MAG: helicase-related protein [Blautia sp.]|uniref:SNF2-related protein n=1 Tax=Blautia sp. TaxID=1955243 RepID=UPI002A8100BB|nr:SNF2-related protein [Blautia sp.]MCI5963045.1 SNF2-related protein [Clostridia bacterium]MDY4054027.1 helicase-related protein [Blautia sp.]
MNDSYIISKMNEYMFQLNERMGKWLNKRLPQITANWWDELVLNNLSTLQKDKVLSSNVQEISGLDLASILRVFDRNWFVITSSFFVNNKERRNIHKMQDVRNSWAHITPKEITKKKVIEDVETIIALMQAFDATMKDTRDMENFIFDIEDDKDIQIEPAKKPEKKPDTKPSGEIGIGSLVTLVSDSSAIGAVIGKDGNRYTVLINGKVENFYEEQIRIAGAKTGSSHVSLQRVRTALTAYQISNPGSSNLYSLNSARIDFVPYQFRPALKMIKSDSPRLLVADDVGVGKTIEAGLILKELEARDSINSVLIICPRPLVAERKWELEMKRFDENFTQMDGKAFAEAISETHRDGAWPERHNKTIIPYSLFGEDSIMGTQSTSSRRKKNLGLAELDPVPHFDLVIVDEAHNIRNANTWMYRGVEIFCRNADAVVFLTATPLQNSNDDLYTLLNLLRPDVVIDKDTFRTMAEPNAYINNLLRIVRNQEEGWQEAGKDEISHILNTTWGRSVIQHNPDFGQIYDFLEKETVTRDEKVEMISKVEALHSFHAIINRTRRKDIEDFCIRRNLTVKVPYTSVQRNLYDALMEFEATSLGMLHGSQSVRFMMCTIMRQAASCIYGLQPFMKDIIARRMAQIQNDGELYEYDVELNSDEENALFELQDEIAMLTEKLPEEDPKFEKMYEIICEKQKEDNNRVIIFSSFRHTLAYVRRKLEKRGIRVAQVDGSVPDAERYALRQRFLVSRDTEDAIDVLLFSEVGCEGLDYQFCDTMINYDLPWNPMRIEQRIGRIDRRGQKSDTVRIYNMITEDTIDATIYDRCLNKIGVFESSIGDCSEILGDISDQILKIMFDPTLTEEERNLKIEQMADNEVMKVQEMHRLEQDEKSLYGFDLSNYIQNKDVQDAENMWISPQSIQEMVEIFLTDLLGEGEYIRGKGELKNLRLASDKRSQMLANLSTVKIANSNNASKLWNAYLKSNKPTLPITFDSVCAKDNRQAAFLTQMHPLVIQAAAYESNELPCEVGVSISTDELPAGDYEFLIYVWKYVGLRPDIRLVAVSENPIVQKNILNYIQYSSEYEYDDAGHESVWDAMDRLHYGKWQAEKAVYTEDVRNECEYRLERLRHSFNQRETIFRNMIKNAEDERIIRMRQSQLDKLTADFEAQQRKIDETVKRVDIHTNLQVKGILHVEG